ncbi:MAG: glycosyltransferase, partial [Microbacteriaceae bacterium]|nr:glycosyltransferase [Microbacteriaceae bacterium]
MRVDLISREYPPEVYGGAGVHVAELVRALRDRLDVVVRCFGMPRDEADVYSYLVPPELTSANPSLATLGVDLQIAQDVAGADLVHSHTWYANAAGHLAGLLHGIPHVVTAHSLEPLRPWKAEQLGGGYRVSSWIEKTAFEGAAAIIAV